jgi:hypothetical protein
MWLCITHSQFCNYEPSFAYLLTPCSTVLLDKLTGSQLVKKFTAFYRTPRFITTFTSARLLPYPEPARSSPYPHIAFVYQSVSPVPRLSVWTFSNVICFYGEALSTLRTVPTLEDHPSSTVRDCLFNTFAATNPQLLLIIISCCFVN